MTVFVKKLFNVRKCVCNFEIIKIKKGKLLRFAFELIIRGIFFFKYLHITYIQLCRSKLRPPSRGDGWLFVRRLRRRSTRAAAEERPREINKPRRLIRARSFN